MNVKATFVALLPFAAIVVVADLAMAKEIPIGGHNKNSVKLECTQNNGVFWPTSSGGTYGCMNPDGSGIICGGVSKHDKKTCSTFRQVPPRIPLRDEIRLGEKEEKADTVLKE